MRTRKRRRPSMSVIRLANVRKNEIFQHWNLEAFQQMEICDNMLWNSLGYEEEKELLELDSRRSSSLSVASCNLCRWHCSAVLLLFCANCLLTRLGSSWSSQRSESTEATRSNRIWQLGSLVIG